MKEIQTKTGPDAMHRKKTSVVLLVDTKTGNYARGVAICNDVDAFCRKTGRDLAFSRAEAALIEKRCRKSSCIFKDRPGLFVPNEIEFKCAYNPTMTLKEIKFYDAAMNQDTASAKEAA
ncbi:MAG: hypothetical protein GY729_05965 [Desulfobacteraceae bacterium]|nr:hypothetical protein [Desulfobacteraceae bacterium]